MPFADRLVPIFPLPNCVMLPGASQCLHIFEPRYRHMIVDELARAEDDRLIATALLQPGYESLYCTRHAPIHPILCLGRLVKSEQLQDGRFNILLLGLHRASTQDAPDDRPYRRGQLQAVDTVNDLRPDDAIALETRLSLALGKLPPHLSEVSADITHKCLGLERTVDLLAYHLLGPQAYPVKQMLLAEERLDLRAKLLISLVERMCLGGTPAGARLDWPPCVSNN